MSSALPQNLGNLSVAIADTLHTSACDHLLSYFRRGRQQENLCLGLWRPSVGARRVTALVHELVLPKPEEIELAGNVAFSGAYLDRASELAARVGSGLVLMHNHFGPGWQGMSPDDVNTEQMRAAFALSSTGLPFVGMTLGTDGAWSARFWPRTAPRRYERRDCEAVRVVGHRLSMTYHPKIRPVPVARDELLRTISAWGAINQAQIARLHVGIVGAGSVGRLVIEGLARMGIQRVTIIDFDRIERLNLDRQLGAYVSDATARRLKVDLGREGFLAASTASEPVANAVPYAVTEPEGFDAALDCDVIFSCVDRPWGRQVLNHIAYAHLIPVIDGGIIVRTRAGRFKGTEWSVRTAGPGRCCLQCCGQFDPGLVDAERRGLLDDPSYIQGLSEDERAAASQNVFPFSMSLAAHELVQLASLVTGLLGRPDLGEQRYHYNLGEMLTEEKNCKLDCIFQSRVATGESLYPRGVMTGPHPKAIESRAVTALAEPVRKAGLTRRMARWIWNKCRGR